MMTQGNTGMPASSIMTGLLTQRKQREYAKNSAQMFLRPTEEGKFYLVRLLSTTPNDAFVRSSNFAHVRDFPFILQHIHQVWEEKPTEDPTHPKRIPHTIVCPQTDYVKANSTLTKSQCPICAAYGSAWKAFNDSHFTNQEAKARMRNLHNQFRALILVYVDTDPNYDGNKGAVKVLALDEDAYKQLLTAIQAASQANTPIWNQDACNLYFTWGKIDKVVNEGKSNEYTFHKNGFTKIGFVNKVKHLDGLTEEAIEKVGFDANWYQVPTKEDLEQFYLQYCSNQTSAEDEGIPMDIPSAPVVAKAPVAPAPKPAPIPDPVANDVTEDSDNLPFDTPVAPDLKKAALAAKAAPAKKVVEEAKPAKAPAADMNSRIDDILAGLSL